MHCWIWCAKPLKGLNSNQALLSTPLQRPACRYIIVCALLNMVCHSLWRAWTSIKNFGLLPCRDLHELQSSTFVYSLAKTCMLDHDIVWLLDNTCYFYCMSTLATVCRDVQAAQLLCPRVEQWNRSCSDWPCQSEPDKALATRKPELELSKSSCIVCSMQRPHNLTKTAAKACCILREGFSHDRGGTVNCARLR